MAAKYGSMSFNFEVVYTKTPLYKLIGYAFQ